MNTLSSTERGIAATVMFGFAALVLFTGTAHADTLNRQLDPGMSGSDVTALQTYLALDNTIYPQGLITGYFGTLTTAAVSNFQSRNGISTVGRVGPVTLAALNAKISSSASVDPNTVEGAGKPTNLNTPQPILSNIAIATTPNSATINWNSNVAANALVRYSTTWPFVYVTAASVSGSVNSNTQSVTLNNLVSGTTYYYVLESLDNQGNFTWSANGPSFKTN